MTAGDLCLKTKVDEITEWLNNEYEARVKWLKNLRENEKKALIKYELNNYECIYTMDIEPVIEIFEDIFDYRLIISVWEKLKDDCRNQYYDNLER